jgi:hypothetical protein
VGVNADGEAVGSFRPTGSVPKCLDRLRSCGLRLSPTLFNPSATSPQAAHGQEVTV